MTFVHRFAKYGLANNVITLIMMKAFFLSQRGLQIIVFFKKR